MSEPTGIFIDVEIDETDLKKLLNQKFEKARFGKKLGYYFSELLYRSYTNEADSVFIFNYDKKSKYCFIGLLLNHFSDTDILLFPEVLEIISLFKKCNSSNYAIVASTFSELFKAYSLKQNQVIAQSPNDFSKDVVEQIMNKFYSFSQDQQFLSPQKALNKRNFFYKNFKNYFKKYLVYAEKAEKSIKIKKATKNDPFFLFGDFYTYENRVFFKKKVNSFIEIPKADPLTFREAGLSIFADKNHVFVQKWAFPLPSINSFLERNWEYQIIKGIDSKSFEPYKYKFETTYWKDKYAVYYGKSISGVELIKIAQADRESFEELNFGFGKDKDHVFYLDKIISLNANHFILNKNGFIYDDRNIFHYQNQIPLDVKTFKILEYESEQNPFMGTFILEDRSGKYKYNRNWKGETMKVIIE
ncbi:DKNYY domain-containing protein [Aquimarina macrocephali]|uniref:DKNYY domain-containing protein n=1 Tax=Aquimarina macrocephali TaxID=666563 RepID=UPI0004B984A0|nr:DKNYY domain-containing protein [Aquimarina macrocephali]